MGCSKSRFMKSLLLLILGSACCLAAEASPGKAALEFLQQVRAGQVNLDPGKGTAISPYVAERKRLSIAVRLQRLAQDLGNGDLELGREKVEGNLAGVLVWKANGFDPSQMQVFAVALVQRNGSWLPAPVPASFENCGIHYLPETRARMKSLESWMLEGKVRDLALLRDKSIARMRSGIEQHLSREALAKMNAREAFERFMQACAQRNTHEIMGLVGGLSATLPEDWPLRAGSIEEATSGTHATGPWRLLMSPNVMRITVELDEEFGPLHASIACLDPHGIPAVGKQKPRIDLVHLKLERSSDGLWQVVVPEHFWLGQLPTKTHNEDLDRDLLDRIAVELRKQCPAQPQGDAPSARKALVQAMQGKRFADLLRITAIPKDPKAGRNAVLRAAEAWGSLHHLAENDQPASAHHLMDLALEVDGDRAAILVHAFSARKPDRYDPHVLFLQQDSDGWMWMPNADDDTLKRFQAWNDRITREQREAWRSRMLQDCPVIDQLGKEAVSDQEAEALVKRWMVAIEAGDIPGALAQCALLDGPDSSKTLLRNLGYEVVDALRKEGKGLICHVIRKGAWAGVGTQPRNPETRAHSFYPVVSTPKGPRILLEIDLIASSGRGREFLNRTSLNRAEKLGQEAATELAELFQDHCRKSLD